jgi:TorA maturation chaperone TorD
VHSEDSGAAPALAEVLRALAALAEPPSPEHAAIAAALTLPYPPTADEYTDALVFQLPPYASIYLGPEGMLGGEARDRIAGFWRALGGEPPRESDHLSVLLSALAELADTEAATDPRDGRMRTARAALHGEHVASWMPPFLAALRRLGSPFYAVWAATLDDVLTAAAEAGSAGDALAAAPRLPLALRAAPALPDAPADLDDLLSTVLAPIRIGMVIARDDLSRCAGDVGLGLRVGERRFALRALLSQDAPGVLRWLASEAGRQADAYGTRSAVVAWWRDRASAGASWLARLARLADDAGR